MTDASLIAQLVANVSPFMAAQIQEWVSNTETFKRFAHDHKDKICRKLGQAKTFEDKTDVLVELEFAHRVLAGTSFTIQYEPYGNLAGRNPDFLVSASEQQNFNVEVKRVRESRTAIDFREFEQAIKAAVRNVPSSLGVSLDVVNLDAPVGLAYRLRDSTSSVIEQCVQAVQVCETGLADDDKTTVPIRGFEKEIQLTICKVPGKAVTSPTAFFASITPVCYTQRESFKLSDLLIGCLGQLRPSMANVLVVRIHSSTHDPRDLAEAIEALRKQAKSVDDEYFKAKGFENTEDFLFQARALSAVIVKSDWGPIRNGLAQNLWCNPDAEVPLTQNVLDHLKAI